MAFKRLAAPAALLSALLLFATTSNAHARGAFIAKAYGQTIVTVHWGDACDGALDMPNDALQVILEGRFDGPNAHVARVTFVNRSNHVFRIGPHSRFNAEDNGRTPEWAVADMRPHSTQTVQVNYTFAGRKALFFAYPWLGLPFPEGGCGLTYFGVEP